VYLMSSRVLENLEIVFQKLKHFWSNKRHILGLDRSECDARTVSLGKIDNNR